MKIMHVVSPEEAFVRACNGEEIYGCFTDHWTIWYVDLRRQKLFDAFAKKPMTCKGMFWIDSIMTLHDGEKRDIPAGKYSVSVNDDALIPVTSVQNLNRAWKYCLFE